MTGFLSTIFNPSANSNKLYDANYKDLGNVLDALIRLKKNGTINSNEFSFLLNVICKKFIRTELTSIVSEVLTDPIKKIFSGEKYPR